MSFRKCSHFQICSFFQNNLGFHICSHFSKVVRVFFIICLCFQKIVRRFNKWSSFQLFVQKFQKMFLFLKLFMYSKNLFGVSKYVRVFNKCSNFETLLTLKFVLKMQKMSVVEKIVGASKFVFKIQNCSCFEKFVQKFQKCSCLRKMFWKIRNVWVFNSILFFKKGFANLKNVLVFN